MINNATDLIKKHEGFRPQVYDDATGHPIVPGYTCVGHPTIGYGIKLDGSDGLIGDEPDYILENRIADCEEDLTEVFPKWHSYSPARQAALLDMRFNLGPNHFRGFHQMIDAVRRDDWLTASHAAKNSLWFTQTKTRGIDDVKLLETGEF